MEDNKNLGGIDYFKVIAAFLVIAIHTSPLSSFSSNADFIFTRIIARIAVPFYLMVTGYFILPPYLFHKSKDFRPLLRWIKKALSLYAAVIVIYLPVNFYAGQLKGAGISDIFRLILFDGTFYHLWYLPASILGVLVLYLISRKLSFQAILFVSLLLYIFGLSGDSYYGLAASVPVLRGIYDTLFQVFSYTRNGIFYAPIFLALGAWNSAACWKRPVYQKAAMAGLMLSFALMLTEGLLLHHWEVQRHDSMYISLLPCMFFLFQFILNIKKKPVKILRTLSTCIYLIHPLFIVIVRGGAKAFHLENILIYNSLIHYFAVSILSCFFSLLMIKLLFHRKRPSFNRERAWIEINRKKLRQNVSSLHELLPPGCQLMPAVKANAYGHGAVLIAKELSACGVRAFCVATVNEGIQLRRNGIMGEILILGYTHPQQFPLLRRYHLIQTVVDYPYARALNTYGKKIKVHIKIDTGMHRLGIRHEKIDEVCMIFQCSNLKVEGAYTHLCADDTAEADKKFTLTQGEAFYSVIAQLNRRGYRCPKVHLQASNGLLNYPELTGNYARIGIAIYGVHSTPSHKDHGAVQLSPVLSVMARIAAIKDLLKGEGAGYGLKYTANQDRKIAVLTIGYADGLPRALSCGVGNVLINGSKAPIIGRICMDQTLVDITDIPNVKQGDIAIIIGQSGENEITALDVAEQTDTISNEILSRLGERLERIIV